MIEWHPMETAPKDGSPIVLYSNGGCGDVVTTVMWCEKHENELGDGGQAICNPRWCKYPSHSFYIRPGAAKGWVPA